MADGWSTVPVEFRGGLISNLAPIQQGLNSPGSARQLRNFEPSVEGGYKRIEGFTKYDTEIIPQTGVVRGVTYFKGRAIVARGTGLYSSFGDGWTAISTSLGGAGKVRFAKYRFTGTEKLYILDQANKPFTYDGTTFTQLTGLESELAGAQHVVEFKNHIVLAKGNIVYISANFADDDFSFASGGLVNTFNDQITGLIVFREQLFVFTRSTINRIVGSTVADFNIQPVATDLGCVQEDTIQEIGGDVMFLGPDGVRLLSGTDRIGDVGLGALTRVIQKEATEFVSYNSSFCTLVVRKKSQYRIFGYDTNISIPNAYGLIGVQFAAQGGEGTAWAETRGIKAFCGHSEYVDGQEIVLFGNETGYLYRMEQGNSFDGDEIGATFFTPYLPFNDPTIRKTIYAVHVFINPQGGFSTQLNLNYDFGGSDVIVPDPIEITNEITAGENDDPIALYGFSDYATYQNHATADVDGAVADATEIVVDNISGTIAVDDFVTGPEIINSPRVVSVDGNTIELDIAQTLTDNTQLSFNDHTVTLTSTIYGDAVKLTFRTPVTGSGKVVSFEFVSTSSVQPFSLDAMAIELASYGRR